MCNVYIYILVYAISKEILFCICGNMMYFTLPNALSHMLQFGMAVMLFHQFGVSLLKWRPIFVNHSGVFLHCGHVFLSPG